MEFHINRQGLDGGHLVRLVFMAGSLLSLSTSKYAYNWGNSQLSDSQEALRIPLESLPYTQKGY